MLVGNSDVRRKMQTRRGVILKLPCKHCKERAGVSGRDALLHHISDLVSAGPDEEGDDGD